MGAGADGDANDYDYGCDDGMDPPLVQEPFPSVSRLHHSQLSELLEVGYPAQACWRYHGLGQMPPRGYLMQMMLCVRSSIRWGQHSGLPDGPHTTVQAGKSECGGGPCVIKRWTEGSYGNQCQCPGRRSSGRAGVRPLRVQ